MARRKQADRLEAELAELRALTDAGPSTELNAALRRALSERSSIVAACATWFAAREDEWRASGAIGPRPAVPADADPQTALLAAFGRERGAFRSSTTRDGLA